MTEEMVELDLTGFKRHPPKRYRDSYYGRICEYTLGGQFIRSYASSREAAEKYNITPTTISACCKGSRLYVHKISRIFLYANRSVQKRLNAIKNQRKHPCGKSYRVAVEEYDLDGNLIKVWDTLSSIDYCPTRVREICRGERLYGRIGHRIFLFPDDDIQKRLELIKLETYRKNLNKSIDEYTVKGSFRYHWKNAREIAKKYKFKIRDIVDCCTGDKFSINGSIFLFSGDSIKTRLKNSNKQLNKVEDEKQ